MPSGFRRLQEKRIRKKDIPKSIRIQCYLFTNLGKEDSNKNAEYYGSDNLLDNPQSMGMYLIIGMINSRLI
jgi:hypothetical protein